MTWFNLPVKWIQLLFVDLQFVTLSGYFGTFGFVPKSKPFVPLTPESKCVLMMQNVRLNSLFLSILESN